MTICKNSWKIFVVLLAIILMVSGCASKSKIENEETISTPYGNNFSSLPIRIGILTDKQGQNAVISAAADNISSTIENQLAVTVDILDISETSNPQDAITYLSDKGLRLIFVLGGADHLASVAPKYPNINYVCLGYEGPSLKNINSVNYRLTEPGYIGGVLAASVSKVDNVGFIAGSENASTDKELAAFRDGVNFVGQLEGRDILVSVEFVDVTNTGYKKVDKAEAKTIKLAEQACDFIYSDCGLANKGVMAALNQLQIQGTMVDINKVTSDMVINTFILSLERSMFEIARNYIQSEKVVDVQPIGLKEKAIVISSLEEGNLEQSILDRLSYVREEIISGRINFTQANQ